jgi:hypothetical protein
MMICDKVFGDLRGKKLLLKQRLPTEWDKFVS